MGNWHLSYGSAALGGKHCNGNVRNDKILSRAIVDVTPRQLAPRKYARSIGAELNCVSLCAAQGKLVEMLANLVCRV